MELFNDPKRIKSDLKMVASAMSGKWNISDDKMNLIVERLAGIVEKEEVAVATKDGVVHDEYKADANAIRAATLLRQMVSDNQPKESRGPLIGVNIDNRTNADRSGSRVALIAARLGADRVSGIDRQPSSAECSGDSSERGIIYVDNQR